jgi:hypothetical protein
VKKRIFLFLLAAVLLVSSCSNVYAKGGSFKSGGFSGKSFSRSIGKSSSTKGYSGSSKSSKSGSSIGSLFGSSKSKSSSDSSGYSGSSSTRKAPGSYSSGSSYTGSSSSKSAASSKSSKASTMKSSYMQDTYKKQVSQNNYSTYKQKLNTEQKKVYEDSFSKSYRMNNRMDFDYAMRSRPQRINMFGARPLFINVNPVYFGSPFSYGHAFVGAWDLWFLMRASEMFWFHHWNEISPYRDYFEAQRYAELEKRVKELEQQGTVRDPEYMDPDVDPDLQLSSEYQDKNLDNIYYTNKDPGSTGSTAGTVVAIAVVALVLIMAFRHAARPRPRKYNRNSIY